MNNPPREQIVHIELRMDSLGNVHPQFVQAVPPDVDQAPTPPWTSERRATFRQPDTMGDLPIFAVSDQPRRPRAAEDLERRLSAKYFGGEGAWPCAWRAP